MQGREAVEEEPTEQARGLCQGNGSASPFAE